MGVRAWRFLGPIVLFLQTGCAAPEYEHDAEYILILTCEDLAEDYREDPQANPELCEGYDADGWPIKGARPDLPDNWRPME